MAIIYAKKAVKNLGPPCRDFRGGSDKRANAGGPEPVDGGLLLNLGEPVPKAKRASSKKKAKSVGGGWYLMPDGSKVRGKKAAGLE